MKKVLIIVGAVLLLLIAGAAFYFWTISNQIMDGDGMINQNYLMDTLMTMQGEYEYSFGQRLIIDDDTLMLRDEGEVTFETRITDAFGYTGEADRTHLVLDEMEIVKHGAAYATVTDCYHENGSVTLICEFSFGSRELVYTFTDQPEFAYYDIITDEMMSELEGVWRCDENSFEIKEGTISFYYGDEPDGEPESICVVRENTGSSRVFVTSSNLYADGVGMFSKFEYKDGILSAAELILDEDAKTFEFTKE